MKKLFLVLLFALIATPASAASKPLTQIATLGDISSNAGLFIDKSTIYTFGNIESATMDAVITSYDAKGIMIARNVIDSGGSDYFAAATSDGIGNIWFVGGVSPAVESQPVETAAATAVNPDGITVEVIPTVRSDITTIVLWKFTLATGELSRYSFAFSFPILATGISADSKGVSAIGVYKNKTILQNFLISANTNGKFSPAITIGGAGTVLNAIQRMSDGSIDLFGSSTESLGGTKLVGKVDGVLIKVKSNKIAQVVRSSAPKAIREWSSVGSSTFLMGTIQTGNKVEIAATKFANFKPVWNVRYPSTGSVAGILNSSGAFLAYSTSAGMNLSTFSTKGVVGQVYNSAAIARPLAMAYSKELGIITLAEVGNQASIFTPTSG